MTTKMIMVMKKIVCYDNCARVHIKQFKFSNSFHLLLKKIMYEKISQLSEEITIFYCISWSVAVFVDLNCVWAVEKRKFYLLDAIVLKALQDFFFFTFRLSRKNAFYSILWKSHKYHIRIYMENAHAFQQLLMLSFI